MKLMKDMKRAKQDKSDQPAVEKKHFGATAAEREKRLGPSTAALVSVSIIGSDSFAFAQDDGIKEGLTPHRRWASASYRKATELILRLRSG